MKTDAEMALEVKRKVKSICGALATGGPRPSPEELADRAYACLLAAVTMRLIVAGHRQDNELAVDMVDAAYDAMEAALDRSLALRN